MKVVYHGSPHSDIIELNPCKSTHEKSYVYAAKDKELALLFTQKWNDFILNVAYGDDGILEVTERYKGALEEVYDGKKGYIYDLDSYGFLEDKTCFEGEVVTSDKVKVLNCEIIEDSLRRIKELEKKGNIRIFRYPMRHIDIPSDDSDLVEEALYFYKKGNKDIIDYCIRKHPNLKCRFDFNKIK